MENKSNALIAGIHTAMKSSMNIMNSRYMFYPQYMKTFWNAKFVRLRGGMYTSTTSLSFDQVRDQVPCLEGDRVPTIIAAIIIAGANDKARLAPGTRPVDDSGLFC